MRAALLSFVLALTACATGADSPPAADDDGVEEPDAEAPIGRPDARPRPDAAEDPPPPDARVDPPPDAEVPVSPDAASGPFCFSNPECPAPDECCIGFGPGNPGFCGPGTEVGEFCLPD